VRALLPAALALGLGCATYRGPFRPFDPASLRAEPGWVFAPGVHLVRQAEARDCGPAALAMVLGSAGMSTSREQLAGRLVAVERGAAAGELRDLARAVGARAFLVHGEVSDLRRELSAGRPALVGLAKRNGGRRVLLHYEVVVGLHEASGRVATFDPGAGPRQAPLEGFLGEWSPTGRLLLVVMANPEQ